MNEVYDFYSLSPSRKFLQNNNNKKTNKKPIRPWSHHNIKYILENRTKGKKNTIVTIYQNTGQGDNNNNNNIPDSHIIARSAHRGRDPLRIYSMLQMITPVVAHGRVEQEWRMSEYAFILGSPAGNALSRRCGFGEVCAPDWFILLQYFVGTVHRCVVT